MKIFVGCLFILLMVVVLVVWVFFGGFTKLELRQIWDEWTCDCVGAGRLVDMSFQAVGGARQSWSEDPCGELSDSDCQIFLLTSSISKGCVSNTGADCFLGRTLVEQRRYQESIQHLESCVSRIDSAPSLWYLAHSYHQLGMGSEAKAAKDRLMRVRSRFPNRVDDDHLPEDPFVEH